MKRRLLHCTVLPLGFIGFGDGVRGLCGLFVNIGRALLTTCRVADCCTGYHGEQDGDCWLFKDKVWKR
jgi:hypothetical protein